MKSIVNMLFILVCASCTAQQNSKVTQMSEAKIDSAFYKLNTKRETIILAIFSLENMKSDYLDINILDSFKSKLTSDSLLNVAFNNEVKKNGEEYIKSVEKWLYCYSNFESVFVFKEHSEGSDYSFEEIILDLPELKNVLQRYVPNNSTVDALSTSQSQMLFLDCVNYTSQLNEDSTIKFFEKYYYVASKKSKQ